MPLPTVVEKTVVERSAEVPLPRRTLPRGVHIAVATALLLPAVALLSINFYKFTSSLTARDFIAYWSAGQLLARHSNPYGVPEVYGLEKQVGYAGPGEGSIMLNPPWALPLVVPLGFANVHLGALLWTLAVLASIIVSVRLLWMLHGRPPNRRHLLAYAFAPVFACFMTGSMAAFVLLGLSLFLWLRKDHPFAAGAAFALLAIKPHIFLLFGLILLADCLRRKEFLPLLGLSMFLALASVLPTFFDPNIWSHYLGRASTANFKNAFVPTLSFVLRILVHRNSFWLQFVPEGLAGIWAAWYYVKNRQSWDWIENGMIVILVSVLVAPYSTFFDEIVLLPAMLHAFQAKPSSRTSLRRSLAAFVAINVLFFALVLTFKATMMSGLYIWTPVAWVVWYVWSVRNCGVQTARAPAI